MVKLQLTFEIDPKTFDQIAERNYIELRTMRTNGSGELSAVTARAYSSLEKYLAKALKDYKGQ